MTRKHGDRFRLLIYERMWQRWAWPCTLIIPASLVLWWFAYRIPIIYALFRPLALVPALVAGVILAYAYLARHLAWVQCRSEHLRIRAPFYTLVVSYGRIRTVRPNNFSQVFDPRKEREARLRWLHPYWGKTVLLVELSRYPFSKTWLRLWFNPYLLTPSSSGFIFLVEDWMALSRQLDEYRNVWVMRRAKRRQRASAKRL